MEVSWRAYRAYGDRVYYEALAKDLKAEDMEKFTLSRPSSIL